MNDFSMESILFKNIVPSSNISNIKTSKSIDECVYDAYKSEEELKFYETYTMINDYNTKQKLRMLNKLRNTTNRIHNTNINNSCESYIRSIEETTNTDNNTTQNVEKKKNRVIEFFKMIGRAIKKICQKIGHAIMAFFRRFTSKYREILKKTDDDYFREEVDMVLNDDKLKRNIIDDLVEDIKLSDEVINIFDPVVDREFRSLPSELDKTIELLKNDMYRVFKTKDYDYIKDVNKKIKSIFNYKLSIFTRDDYVLTIDQLKKELFNNFSDFFGSKLEKKLGGVTETLKIISEKVKEIDNTYDDFDEKLIDFIYEIKDESIREQLMNSQKVVMTFTSDMAKVVRMVITSTKDFIVWVNRIAMIVDEVIKSSAMNNKRVDNYKYNIKPGERDQDKYGS